MPNFAHVKRVVGVLGITFRSKAEANYAAYLEWLRILGKIVGWSYEPCTFWFTPDSDGAREQRLAGVRRGVVSYKPDFAVYEANGTTVWHEVKGYMDQRSKVTLARFARYYPGERLELVDSKAMAVLKRQVGGVVPGWAA